MCVPGASSWECARAELGFAAGLSDREPFDGLSAVSRGYTAAIVDGLIDEWCDSQGLGD